MAWRVGIDSGGTFTDLVAVEEGTNKIVGLKVPSTPADPSVGALDGIRKLCNKLNIHPKELCEIIHGTTVATNAIIQGRLGSIGLLTTKGHRDVLEIGRQTVPGAYGNIVWWMKPERIVALHNVREVYERINYKGEILIKIEEKEIREIACWYKRAGIKAVAVCFLHSYANPEHEFIVKNIFENEYPECSISLSSDVVAEFREYERTVTTCVNAGLMPLVTDYIRGMKGRLKEVGVSAPLLIMKSNGGVVGINEIVKVPVAMALSGPAAGVAGSVHAMTLAGYENFIGLDMGGTSADICRVTNGRPSVSTDADVAEAKIKLSMIDIVTIGAGGGSIAWVATGKALKVGPQSAGADPGPACYAKGGKEATVTDAQLFLGRLPNYLLGGEVKLNSKNAELAINKIAGKLELTPVETAAGILRIAIENMCNAIRQVSIRQGIDPREYNLLVFGGAGAFFGADIMDELKMPTCIVPPSPGTFSASGLLTADIVSDFIRTDTQSVETIDVNRMKNVISELEEEASAFLMREGIAESDRKLTRSVDIRYEGQGYEVRTDFPLDEISMSTINKMIQDFNDKHEKLFGFAYRGSPVEFVTWRVAGIGVRSAYQILEIPPAAEKDQSKALTSKRKVFFIELNRFIDCNVYKRDKLLAGNLINGPAIIDGYDSTIIVNPRHSAGIDKYGNVIIRRTENA